MSYNNTKRKPSNSSIITANWKTVPWEKCYQIYEDAASLAEQTAKAERVQSYKKYLDECLLKNEEPKDFTELPSKTRLSIRREAGNKAILTDFIPKYKIADFAIHYMPQIVAHIATMKLYNISGEIFHPSDYKKEWLDDTPVGPGIAGNEFDESCFCLSALQFLEANFKDEKMKGLHRFLMLDSRSSFIKQQYKGEARAYCTLVPTIMFAFKLYHDIPYSAWNHKEAKYIMPQSLYEAATLPWEAMQYSTEELLAFRDKGLVWKTGEKAGQPRSPIYTHRLFGMGDTEFGKLPELAQVMLSQIWCAHPENRTKYMILDPIHWDSVPPSLIPTNNVFEPSEYHDAVDNEGSEWL